MTIKVDSGTFSKPTSTSTPVAQDVTHAGGFTGNVLILFGVSHSAATATHSQHASISYGFSDGTNHRSVCANAKSEAVWQFNTSETFRRSASTVYTSLGDGTNATRAECTVTGFSNNQFSLSWTTNNAVADIIHYIVMQVDNVKVGEFTAKTGSTGTQDTTGLGFTPVDGDLILFLSASGTAALPSTINHGLSTIGAMTSATTRATNTVSWEHNVTTTDTHTLQKTDKALSLCLDSTGAIDSEADFSAWISDGFQLNWTDFAASAWKIFYLAIHGGNWEVGNDTQPTSVQTKTTNTGAAVDDVKGLILVSAGLAAAATVQEGGRRTIGAASSTTTENCAWSQMADGMNSNVNTLGGAVREYYTDKMLSCQTTVGASSDVAPTINSQCTLDSFGTDQFALNWATTDATARQFIYIVVGETVSATQYNRNVEDTITVSEASLVAMRTLPRVPSSDSTTVADASLTRTTQAFRSPSSDSVTITDTSLTRVMTLPRVPTAEDVTVADASTTRMLSVTRAPNTENPAVSENLTRATQAFRTPSSDSTTVVDSSLTRILSLVRSPTADSITAEDSSTTQTITRVRTPTAEDITAADSSLTRMLQAFRSVSTDTVDITEDVTGGKMLEREPTADTITVTESSLTRLLSAYRQPTDEDITVVDSSLTRLLSAVRSPSSDSITTSEDLSISKLLGRVPSTDSITVADSSLTRLLSFHRLPSADDITTGENLTRILSAIRSPSPESVTAEDSSTTQSMTRVRAPTADTTSISEDSLTRMLSVSRSVSADTITISEDSLTRMLSAIRLPSVEVITVAEDIDVLHTTAGQFNRTPNAENVTVGENLTRALQLFRIPSTDSITVNENLSGGKLLERLVAAETIDIVEQSLTRVLSLSRNVQETSNVVEASLTRLLQALRVVDPETVTVNELQSLVSHSRSIQDTIIVTEPLLERIVTSIRQLGPEFVDVSEQVFFQTWHRFVFDSVTIAEQLFIERISLSGSVTYATADEVRPLLGNLGQQRTNAQIELAIAAAYDEINRKTNRIPPNDWKSTEPDFDIIKKICRFKAAYEMSIGIKDFASDREALQKEIDEMFMIIEQHDPGGTLSNDMVISSDDETYALNPNGLIWSTRYKNLKKGSAGSENDTTINPDT